MGSSVKMALLLVAMMIVPFAAGQDCDANRLCADNMCCSQWGYCGCTSDYCGSGCKSQCNGCGGGGGVDGEATYYSPYVPSACYGYDTSKFPAGNLIAAASRDLYNGGGLCGAYYEITCKGSVASGKGCKSSPTVKVRVVDLCPGCKANSFDLSYEAFSKIADPDVGRIKISSRKVSGAGVDAEAETEMIAQVV